MSDKLRVKLPKLVVTNPILLWLFAHGWEDPGWGRTPQGQLAIGSAIRELANQLEEGDLQREAVALSGKMIRTAAEKIVG